MDSSSALVKRKIVLTRSETFRKLQNKTATFGKGVLTEKTGIDNDQKQSYNLI